MGYDPDPGGILTALPDPNRPKFRMRACLEYAKQQGKHLYEPTDEEVKMFEYFE